MFTEEDAVFVEALLRCREHALALATTARTRLGDSEATQLATGVAMLYPQEVERARALLASWGRSPAPTGDQGGTATTAAPSPAPGGCGGVAELPDREADRRFVTLLLENQREMFRLATVRLRSGATGGSTQLASRAASEATVQIAGLQKMLRRLP